MTWFGVDGEGIGRSPHRYVLLCAASSDGWQDYVEDTRGLSTEAALRFLLGLPAAHAHRKEPRGHVGGYFLSYDWTMILKDLPNRLLYRLLRPELRSRSRDEGSGFVPVHWRDWQLHYLSGMMRIRRGERVVTVWDLGKYYQARFVAALEASGIAPSKLIERMKAERGTWNERDLDRMRDYCLEECFELSRLAELLEAQHGAIGLSPDTWYGPGSTASALLRKHGVEKCHAAVPRPMVDVVDRAYFGGRFEQSVIGPRAGQFSYDIRSAYPFAATRLPCLAHGKWVHRRRAPKDGAVAVVRYRVRDIGERVWGPLPCRLADGSIVWPRAGSEGWVWNVEFEQATRNWSGVEYAREHWELVRRCDCEPFAFMRELYDWRTSRPENKQVVKLAMNSCYGKLAQSTGGGSRWSSRVWAGLITATCRAMMLELLGKHADESRLSAIATDGAYSSEELDIAGEALGGWEVGEKGLMTFVRPGIYWADADILTWYGRPSDKTVAEAAAKAVKSRGLSRRHMLSQVSRAEAAIVHGVERAELGTTTQFGGARECVYRTSSGAYRRSRLYGEWYDMPATLSLKPEPKRDADWRPPALAGVLSEPYRPGKSLEAKLLKRIGSMLEGRLR